MRTNIRQRRLGELIQRELATILLRYSTEPLLTRTTVMSVTVAPDLALAKVFFSILDITKLDATLAVIHKNINHIRHALAQKLNLRITPKLTFIYDDTEDKAQKLSALINTAITADQKRHDKI